MNRYTFVTFSFSATSNLNVEEYNNATKAIREELLATQKRIEELTKFKTLNPKINIFKQEFKG